MSNSLRPQGLQHIRLPCPSPAPGACSNSWPLSQWSLPTISFFVVPFSSCLQSFPDEGLFQWVCSLHQVTKVLEFQLQHQSFQWTPGLISFRMDWLDLLAVQRTFKSLLQHHNLKASILQHSAFFTIQLSPLHNLSLYMRQIDVLPQDCPLGGFPSTETLRCSLSRAIIHWLPTAGCYHMSCQWLLSLEIPGAHREFLMKPETWHEGGTVKQKEQLHGVSKVPVFPLYLFPPIHLCFVLRHFPFSFHWNVELYTIVWLSELDQPQIIIGTLVHAFLWCFFYQGFGF